MKLFHLDSRGAAALTLALLLHATAPAAEGTAPPNAPPAPIQVWLPAYDGLLIRADGQACIAIQRKPPVRVAVWGMNGELAGPFASLPNPGKMLQAIPANPGRWIVTEDYDPAPGESRRTAFRSDQKFRVDPKTGKMVQDGQAQFSEYPHASRLVILDADGQKQNLGTGSGDHLLPTVNADGTFVAALVYRSKRWQIGRFALADASEILCCPLPDAGKNGFPISDLALSKDGTSAWFARELKGRLAVQTAVIEADSAPRTVLAQKEAHCFAPAPAPSGTQVAFVRRLHRDLDTWRAGDEAWLVNADGTAARRVFAPAGGESVQAVAWLDDSQLAVLVLHREKLPKGAPSPVAITPGADGIDTYRLVHLTAESGAVTAEIAVDTERMRPR